MRRSSGQPQPSCQTHRNSSSPSPRRARDAPPATLRMCLHRLRRRILPTWSRWLLSELPRCRTWRSPPLHSFLNGLVARRHRRLSRPWRVGNPRGLCCRLNGPRWRHWWGRYLVARGDHRNPEEYQSRAVHNRVHHRPCCSFQNHVSIRHRSSRSGVSDSSAFQKARTTRARAVGGEPAKEAFIAWRTSATWSSSAQRP